MRTTQIASTNFLKLNLLGRTLKPPLNLPVRSRDYFDPQKKVNAILSSVLFHGTVRYIVKKWMIKGGIGNKKLSLTSDPRLAGSYTDYSIEQICPDDGEIILKNSSGRSICTQMIMPGCPGLEEEYNSLANGIVWRSIVMFDRDSLLRWVNAHKEHYTLYADEPLSYFGGLLIDRHWQDPNPSKQSKTPWPASIPFGCVIASLDICQKMDVAIMRVFQPRLWNSNFNLRCPEYCHNYQPSGKKTRYYYNQENPYPLLLFSPSKVLPNFSGAYRLWFLTGEIFGVA